MSTKLKAVETPEQGPKAEELTEELPPIHIDPTSFEARMAGVESCSVVREISKHWSTVSAFEVEQEGRVREREDRPSLRARGAGAAERVMAAEVGAEATRGGGRVR